MDYFTFNNVSSINYGLELISSTHLTIPAKKIEEIEIPGRTGSLIIDDGSRKNSPISVKCFLYSQDKGLRVAVKEISEWLQSPIGYCSLSYSDGSVFRAVCNSSIEVNALSKNMAEVCFKFSATEVN